MKESPLYQLPVCDSDLCTHTIRSQHRDYLGQGAWIDYACFNCSCGVNYKVVTGAGNYNFGKEDCDEAPNASAHVQPD